MRWTQSIPFVLWASTVVAGAVWLHQRDEAERARSEAVTRELSRLETAVESASASMPAPGPPAVASPLSIDARSADSLASAVAARVHGPGVVAAASSDPRPPAPPTAEQRAAAEAAHQVLDAAIERGQISSDDVRAMRDDLQHADYESGTALRRALAVAINTNRVVPAGPHFRPL